VRKELLKASYVTARAEVQMADEILAPSDPEAAAEAAGRLREVSAEIRQELGRQPLPDGLLELRPATPAASAASAAFGTPAAPGAPGDGDIRLIFGLEPPGTALMIAVLEGREAARDQYRDAVLLSADVLLEARAGQAPEASARAYDDTRSLAEEFFPGQAAEVEAGAAALAARNRARTLAEERTRLGLSQTEVAQRMGVSQDQVAGIERADSGTIDVRTLISYIEALGGRLNLTADFGGDRIILR
jgi:DNA-binding XRE family transcriptional regulator